MEEAAKNKVCENEKMLEAISSITEITRLQIVLFLGKNGRACVNDITGNFNISRPAISHHLKVLKNCGIVDSEKVGQEIYYFAVRKNIVEMLRRLADAIENCC